MRRCLSFREHHDAWVAAWMVQGRTLRAGAGGRRRGPARRVATRSAMEFPHPAMPAEITRVGTGIARLDDILAGGLPSRSVTVLAGAPGSGKTILAQQICFHQSAG